MYLKFCDDDFWFKVFNTEIINIICLLSIIFCIVFCYIIQHKTFNSGNKLFNIIKKGAVFLISLLFLFFILMLLYFTLNAKNFEGCSCGVSKLTMIPNSNILKNITHNKVIIIGDSRMEYIELSKDSLNVPINFTFIASNGKTFEWFNNVAKEQLVLKLNKREPNYEYHVVINMGVNDLNFKVAESIAAEYFKAYQDLALNYPNVKFYLLSVNPVIENIINIYFPYNQRTNAKIIAFNSKIVSLTKQTHLHNLKNCDSYNEVDFASKDGLHYTRATNQKIIDYIVNNCVDY